MGKPKQHPKAISRTVKYLHVAPNSDIVQAVLKKAPKGVIRAISNAALNAREGDVHIPPCYLNLFKNHRHHFDILTDSQIPIERKRELLTQRGGALPIVVPLLATVLTSLGSEFISRIFHRDE